MNRLLLSDQRIDWPTPTPSLVRLPHTRSESHSPSELKIGVFGPLHGFGLTPPAFFDFFQTSSESLYVYLVAEDRSAEMVSSAYGSHVNLRIIPNDVLQVDCVGQVANLIRDDGVQDLFLAMRDYEASFASSLLKKILPALRIAYISPGALILPDETTATNLLAQKQLDFNVSGSRLESTWGKSVLSNRTVSFPAFYDSRGITEELDTIDDTHYLTRHVLLSHGRLAKYQNPGFLRAVQQILEVHPELVFRLIGDGSEGERSYINGFFTRCGLRDQVDLSPHLSYGQGVFNSELFRATIFEHLRNAALYLDPWPCGGGASLFEAYLAGCPVVSLELHSDHLNSLDFNQKWVCIPQFTTLLGSAGSPRSYVELALSLLSDNGKRQQLIQDQKELAGLFTSSHRWWTSALGVLSDFDRET